MSKEQERLREQIANIFCVALPCDQRLRHTELCPDEWCGETNQLADAIIALKGFEIRADDQTVGPLENWVKVVVKEVP